jgi:hypothetical protein
MGLMNHLLNFATASALLLAVSCAAPLPPKKITVKERIAFDREIGDEILKQLEPELVLKKDPTVQAFLKKIGQTLADKTPDLHIPEIKASLLTEDPPKLRWESFAIPGGHLYLSLSVLKDLTYENEVSALMAIQLGRLLKEQVLDYIKKNPATESSTEPSKVKGEGALKTLRPPEHLVFFNQGGMFDFTEKQDEDTLDAAFSVLYAGGYDTRGMIVVLLELSKLAQANPALIEKEGRIAGLRAADLPALLEYARKRLVYQPPLRNPIIQSKEFVEIRKRLGKL